MKKKSINIPAGVIERLSTYLKCLMQLDAESVRTVSSKRLENLTGTNAAQIRRDLIYFGNFGINGVGYEVRGLAREIQEILGADKLHNIVVMGAGNLGSAISNHDGLKNHGFIVKAIFDSDENKIGREINGIRVYGLSDLTKVISRERIEIGILATPPGAARESVKVLTDEGVRVILNYTSIVIEAPKDVIVYNSDPVNDLLYTLYYFTSKKSE